MELITVLGRYLCNTHQDAETSHFGAPSVHCMIPGSLFFEKLCISPGGGFPIEALFAGNPPSASDTRAPFNFQRTATS